MFVKLKRRSKGKVYPITCFGGTEGCRSVLPNGTNKMQCYTIFFIAVNALHVSGGETARNM